MPRLTMFAPCDNVIIHKDTESASLITIMTQVTFPQVPDKIEPGMVVPMRWFFFCNWVHVPSEFGKQFEQRLRMVNAGDEIVLETIQPFVCVADKIHGRLIGQFNVFPVVPPGLYFFRIALRESGGEEWKDAGVYPLMVILGGHDDGTDEVSSGAEESADSIPLGDAAQD